MNYIGTHKMQITTKLHAVFKNVYDKLRSGELKTFIPLLGLFKIGGKPMSLQRHYQFAPVFNTVQPGHAVFMTGRQVGKTHSFSADMALRSALVPHYHTVMVQPRADQIQRLVNTVYKPLINTCPIRDALISNVEHNKMALRVFNNGSMCFAEHAFESVDRLRGISAIATTTWDEVQDIEYDFLDVGNEMMSASLFWGFARYFGTPKTTDTTLALLWDRSSKAEWVIKCTACNHMNIPNPEQDLVKMIGKHGPICAKCGRAIYPHQGGYIHASPDRALTFPGYHISQTIHPLHMATAAKWQRLLDKVESYTEMSLFNEVFGWPYDAAVSPLTLADLMKTTHTNPTVEKPSDLVPFIDKYRYITVAVDWSGGGMISDSYTAYSVLGLRKADDVIEVIYGKRIPKGVAPADEAREILNWITGVGADAFAYDNGGAGFTRLEILNMLGLQAVRNLTTIPINYVRPRAGDVMKPHTGMRESDLYYYTLDKSRSLAVCIMAIKAGRIRFTPFKEDDPDALPKDFLALREDPRVSLGKDTVILIVKKPGVPDDFAHAVNMGCSQIWDHFGAYPQIGTRYDASILDYDENNNKIMPDEVFGPRGDFERFRDAVELRASVIQPNNPF